MRKKLFLLVGKAVVFSTVCISFSLLSSSKSAFYPSNVESLYTEKIDDALRLHLMIPKCVVTKRLFKYRANTLLGLARVWLLESITHRKRNLTGKVDHTFELHPGIGGSVGLNFSHKCETLDPSKLLYFRAACEVGHQALLKDRKYTPENICLLGLQLNLVQRKLLDANVGITLDLQDQSNPYGYLELISKECADALGVPVSFGLGCFLGDN